MAMGKRKQQQEALFVTYDNLPRSAGHPFYLKLNRLLNEAGFDRWIEQRCAPYYSQEEKRGQPSIPPGTYFRMLMVGYFENIGSQRGIAWRCADSLSLREFLGVPLGEDTPDHSSMTRIRKRFPAEVFREMFQFVLQIAEQQQLLSGKTVGVDSTTLEANAAMNSIVRRDTGEDWQEYLTRLMREEGLAAEDEQPTDEDLRRFDKRRKKKVSNEEWQSTTDPDSRIARMKDGRTHLAYKAEHVVDLQTDMVLAAEIHPADHGDSQTMVDSVVEAQANLQAAGSAATIEEVAADKGYHSAANLTLCETLRLRTYIPEPQRRHGNRWTDKPEDDQRCVYNNRRRIARAKSKRLQRARSELCERSFAHICNSGGMRRSWLWSLVDVSKRYLIAAAAHNLGRILFKLFGIGKPRALQAEGGLAGFVQLINAWLLTLQTMLIRFLNPIRRRAS